jgi:UDP-N-acetylmuramoyl-tripeptide--D-alanyl-D-alanine ligase
LTILGEESGGKNPIAWLIVFIKAIVKLFFSAYPSVLVLEFGADRPGDIRYLAGLVGKIKAAIITDIGITHLEFFGSAQELAKEKLSLIKHLPEHSVAVLNFDSPKVYDGRNQTKARVIGYGFSSGDLLASDFHLIRSGDAWGINFKVNFKGTSVPFFLSNALGRPAAYAALAAAGVGLHFGLNLVTISEALKKYKSPAGRLKVIVGIANTTVLDDSYNASPASVIASLEVLEEISIGRKIAAIGSMAELGTKTESGHREVARKIMEIKTDLVFLVGDFAKIIEDELKQNNFEGQVFWFKDSDEAKKAVRSALLEKDTVLVKGSQSARMEKVVKEIMGNPRQAKDLLVRQSESWTKV